MFSQPDADSCVAAAGFGLGELTALVYAGSIEFNAAVKLAAIREEAMRQIAVEEPSGLMAVVYGPDSKLGQACVVAQKMAEKQGRNRAFCGVAAYLYPHCKIVGGHEEVRNRFFLFSCPHRKLDVTSRLVSSETIDVQTVVF